MQTNHHIHTLKFLKSCHLWSIQKPVIECLIAEGNTPKLFTAVDIPGTNTHSDLLGLGVFLVTLTHSQQYSWRGCKVKESCISDLMWRILQLKVWYTRKAKWHWLKPMGDNPNTEEGSVLNTGHRCQWKHNYKKNTNKTHNGQMGNGSYLSEITFQSQKQLNHDQNSKCMKN